MLDGNLSFDSVPAVITDAFKSVIASPGPLNLEAVIIPETLMSDGSLLFERVPDEILDAFRFVMFEPDPTKVAADTVPTPVNPAAVMIPVYVAFPLLLIVTAAPTWKLPVGNVVPIPTFDVVEIFPAETCHPSTAIA